MAAQGLPLPGSIVRRSFGDLVYASFAETIKSPDRYPEARQAFVIALSGIGIDLAQQTLEVLRGQDDKLDRLLDAMAQVPREGGLNAWLQDVDAEWRARWQVLTQQVSRVEEKVDEQTALMKQLLDAVTEKGQVGSGPCQIAHDTLLALARRLRPAELLNFDQAVKELESAIDVALQVLALGDHHPVHQDRFVNEVLRRVRDLTATGQLDQGAASVNDALAELDRRENQEHASARRRRETLLEAAELQGVMLRDAERVASAVERRAALDHPTRTCTSDAFLCRLDAYEEEGNERGVNFSLKVVEVLARRRLQEAEDVDTRGGALIRLGNALGTLGERESKQAKLLESVSILRRAVTEFRRDREPLGWATAQMNLANALTRLASRESGTSLLEEAAAMFCASLEIFDREQMPRPWSLTKTSLGNALQLLGERSGNAQYVIQAVDAYREALSACPRDRALVAWGTIQGNLASSLALLGEITKDVSLLQESVSAFRAAVEGRPRTQVPLLWATAQNNLGTALFSLCGHVRDPSLLVDAVRAHRNALEEFTRERYFDRVGNDPVQPWQCLERPRGTQTRQ